MVLRGKKWHVSGHEDSLLRTYRCLWLRGTITGWWRRAVGGWGRGRRGGIGWRRRWWWRGIGGWWRSTIGGRGFSWGSAVVWASGGGGHEGEHGSKNLPEVEESREEPDQGSDIAQSVILLVNSKSQQQQELSDGSLVKAATRCTLKENMVPPTLRCYCCPGRQDAALSTRRCHATVMHAGRGRGELRRAGRSEARQWEVKDGLLSMGGGS